MKPRIKICCIASVEEAKMAVKYGASALGLVGEMPSGPGPIEDELIKAIVAGVPPPIATFLLTSQTTADTVIAHHQRTGTNTLQLVDALTNREYHKIKEAIPAIKLVQVIHVINETSVDEAIEISEMVDALLLDSGNPKLTVKELGGTGRVHDWKLSKKIVEGSTVPVFLAGGLNAANVKEAIEMVQPFGIDVCSGVRTDGHLHEIKLEAFIRTALS